MASPKKYCIEKLTRGVRKIRSGEQTGVYVTLFNTETQKSNRWPNFLSDQYESDQIAALEQAGEGGVVMITWSAVESGGKTYYNIQTVDPVTDGHLPFGPKQETVSNPTVETEVSNPSKYAVSEQMSWAIETALSEAVELVAAMLSADPRFKSLLKPTKTTSDLLVETTLEIATKFQKFTEGKYVASIEADGSDLKDEPVELEVPDLPKMPSKEAA